jgi:antitoxin HicB
MSARKRNPRLGSTFDEFLTQEGIHGEVTNRAVREVIALLVSDRMDELQLSKTEMAQRMHTSRQALDRLLNPTSGGLTLDTMERAAAAVGKRLKIGFEDAPGQDNNLSA